MFIWQQQKGDKKILSQGVQMDAQLLSGRSRPPLPSAKQHHFQHWHDGKVGAINLCIVGEDKEHLLKA